MVRRLLLQNSPGHCLQAPSAGTRSTGTPHRLPKPRRTQRGGRLSCCRSAPASPNGPGAAVQTCGNCNRHNKPPVTAALTARAPHRGPVLVPRARSRGGPGARPCQGRTWALLGKQRDVGSGASPVLGTLCRLPWLLAATSCWQNAAAALPAHGRSSLDSQRSRSLQAAEHEGCLVMSGVQLHAPAPQPPRAAPLVAHRCALPRGDSVCSEAGFED